MANTALGAEEYIEQSYFFRTLRERLAQNMPTQESLARVRDEILATTRLPMAIEFLNAELKHTGVMGPAMQQLGHYFTPFQAFVMGQAETEGAKFSMELALSVLEREAEYKARGPTPPGLFSFQFETLCRNRLGYDLGLHRMAEDPAYDDSWRAWIRRLPAQLGVIDFADLLYARSEFAQIELRRRNADAKPKNPVLFGEKEGRIAKANHGKDPLYLFAALQRQLGYPAVPRPTPLDPTANLILVLDRKMQQIEARLKIIEGEMKGELDIAQFYVKPDHSGET
jgi:RNAse (barnase) inhibitor barstar